MADATDYVYEVDRLDPLDGETINHRIGERVVEDAYRGTAHTYPVVEIMPGGDIRALGSVHARYVGKAETEDAGTRP